MTVGILGLGLIGGSMARTYRKAGHRVLASDRDKQMLSFAKLAGAVSGELTGENIPECDLILLCVYPEASAAWLEEHGAEINKTALVLDCCGVKTLICKRCFPVAERCGFTFVGGHPMAGSHFPASSTVAQTFFRERLWFWCRRYLMTSPSCSG